jgi:DNA primase
MNLIDEIKYKISIMDLLHRLNIDVKNNFAYSIYKQEKTPSMRIYPATSLYHCFATNQGGDVIQFYQDYYKLDVKQAITDLASIAGIDENYVPVRNTASPATVKNCDVVPVDSMSETEHIYYYERLGLGTDEAEALKQVKLKRIEKNTEIFEHLYNYCIGKYQLGKARHYLTSERKLPLEVLEKFKVFVIENYNEVNNHLKKVFDITDLQRSGLFNRKEDGSGNLIFFKHRIIIPYLHNGKIIYLRGRYFDENGETSGNMSKYIGLSNDKLNVNGTKRFYNTDALKRMINGQWLFIVEGEFDTMAIYSLQRNAIGIPGAGNIPPFEKFRGLLPYKIYLCVDNDSAGNILLDNLKDIFAKLKKEFYIKHLPAKDANDYLIQVT